MRLNPGSFVAEVEALQQAEKDKYIAANRDPETGWWYRHYGELVGMLTVEQAQRDSGAKVLEPLKYSRGLAAAEAKYIAENDPNAASYSTRFKEFGTYTGYNWTREAKSTSSKTGRDALISIAVLSCKF